MAASRDRSGITLLRRLLVLLLGVVLAFPAGLAAAAEDDPADPEPAPTVLTLTGPAYVIDEQTATLRISWTTKAGLPVAARVGLWQRTVGGAWRPAQELSTDLLGRATASVRPRVDTYYQVRGAATQGWLAASSPFLFLDNRPPGVPVVLPARAPKPKPLPAQPRATAPGAAVTVSRIPDAVWSRMVGRSWRKGCPVGRSGLRYLQTNYWGFDGYRHRGELVVRASAAGDFVRAVQGLYERRVPIRSMYLVDRFGYSKRSRGADDFASMRRDNTSAFNCRSVTGRPGVRSPHSYGRALDLNPYENPFRSAVGWLPNRWWSTHAHPRYAWRSGKHVVVRIMRASGFRWNYPRSDPQHFDA